MSTQIALLILIATMVLIFAARGIRLVRPFEKGVVERLGRYLRTANSGITIIIPLAATKLAQTNLRNVIGEMTLDMSLTSRETINTKLREILDDATDKWGTKVVRVEIQRIEPPADVTHSMHQQMKAERERRATILEAEGERQAAIERATGERQAQILKAEGEATAIKTVADATRYQEIAVAEGEAKAIQNVYSAIHDGDPTNDLIAVKYLDALVAIADGKANKVFLPLEATGVMGSIAGVAELFKEKGPAQETS